MIVDVEKDMPLPRPPALPCTFLESTLWLVQSPTQQSHPLLATQTHMKKRTSPSPFYIFTEVLLLQNEFEHCLYCHPLIRGISAMHHCTHHCNPLQERLKNPSERPQRQDLSLACKSDHIPHHLTRQPWKEKKANANRLGGGKVTETYTNIESKVILVMGTGRETGQLPFSRNPSRTKSLDI